MSFIDRRWIERLLTQVTDAITALAKAIDRLADQLEEGDL